MTEVDDALALARRYALLSETSLDRLTDALAEGSTAEEDILREWAPKAAAAEAAWQQEPEPGMLVVLHSLNKDELNGQLGECMAWDAGKERWAVRLLDGPSLSVRPANLRRASPAEPDERAKALDAAIQAAQLLSGMRIGSSEAGLKPTLLLDEAVGHDFGCVMAHQARGDLAMMSGDVPSAVTNLRRAVANGYGLRGDEDPFQQHASSSEQQLVRRVALAGALGNSGDIEGETVQLRKVLSAAPGHIHARLNLGQSLCQSGKEDEAIPELLMALQLPNEGPGRVADEQTVAIIRRNAVRKITYIWGSRASGLSHRHQWRESVELLQKLTAVMRTNLKSDAWIDPSAQTAEAHMLRTHASTGQRGTAAALYNARGQRVTDSDEALQLVLDLARTEANMGADLLELGDATASEEALARGRAALELHPQARGDPMMLSRFLYEEAKGKERAGDLANRAATTDDERARASVLYHEAKELYRTSHQKRPGDLATQQGFSRVQAKAHPDWEFVEVGGVGSGGGFARVLKPGAQLESL